MQTSRKAARDAREPHYFTGIPCGDGHMSPRLTASGNCVQCRSTYNRSFKPERGVLLPAQYVPDEEAREVILGWIDEVNAARGFPPAKRFAEPPEPRDAPLTPFERMIRAAKGLPLFYVLRQAKSRYIPETYGGNRSRADYPGEWEEQRSYVPPPPPDIVPEGDPVLRAAGAYPAIAVDIVPGEPTLADIIRARREAGKS